MPLRIALPVCPKAFQPTVHEAQATKAMRDRDLARDQLRDEEVRVRYLSGTAPYSALSEAEEKLEQISTELRDQELRAEAAKLLHDTVETCRSEAVASIPERVAETATSILRRIAGASFQTVRLSEGLTPTAVSPISVGTAVPLVASPSAIIANRTRECGSAGHLPATSVTSFRKPRRSAVVLRRDK